MQTEGGWTMQVTYTSKAVVRGVNHRGHRYPSQFDATFTRDNGLTVDLRVTVDEQRGPVPVSVTIRSDDGVSGRDGQLPVIKLARLAAKHAALDVSASSEGIYKAGPASPETVKVGPLQPRRAASLDRVADLYREAIETEEQVGDYVAYELGVRRDRAYQLIHEARTAELLPPTKRGRKHA